MKNSFMWIVPCLVIGLVIIAIAGASLLSATSYTGKIAIIRIKGTITSSPSILESSISTEDAFAMIDKVESDPSIRGALIEIDSPGGSVVSSREIAEAVKGMKKPTVCWLGDIAASGAYWVASACDTIVADPLSLTGSIGVTASYLQFAGTLEKYGVRYERFVSGESKDAGSPFRNLTQEEAAGMSQLVDETFQYFLDDVIRNRNLPDEYVERIRGGGLFLAKDARMIGLVDELGTWNDAKEIAKSATGLRSPQFMELQQRGTGLLGLLSNFF